MEFEDIRIVGLDEERTRNPDPSYDLYDMYLELSSTAPVPWAKLFAKEWSFPRHTLWREAEVSGGYVVIHCVPDELEEKHLPHLKEAVQKVNEKYREYVAMQEASERRRAEAERKERERIASIGDSLDFD